jgi:hypothetical protein
VVPLLCSDHFITGKDLRARAALVTFPVAAVSHPHVPTGEGVWMDIECAKCFEGLPDVAGSLPFGLRTSRILVYHTSDNVPRLEESEFLSDVVWYIFFLPCPVFGSWEVDEFACVRPNEIHRSGRE